MLHQGCKKKRKEKPRFPMEGGEKKKTPFLPRREMGNSRLNASRIVLTTKGGNLPDTNIDWTAYMQQTEQYLAGERDYRKIAGDTGPLVYPGAHVYIYRALHGLTSSGSDIGRAQVLFAVLYLMTLGTVLGTYRAAGAPPWVLALLSLSKRAHSVFLLRLFNDGWAVLGLFAAVAAWQRRWWTAGAGLFALGLGVKMVILLALPAVGAGLWQAVGRDRAVLLAAGMGQVQVGFLFLSTVNFFCISRGEGCC
jgi:alpha-1,3-mannosyltransferase